MTATEREAIRARVKAATKGPWWYDSYGSVFTNGDCICPGQKGPHSVLECPCNSDDYEWKEVLRTPLLERCPNATFAADARQDIPALLDALDDQEKRVMAVVREMASLTRHGKGGWTTSAVKLIKVREWQKALAAAVEVVE